MKLISCHDGKLHALNAGERSPALMAESFRTGLAAWDALPPGEAFVRGAVHEFLSSPAHPKSVMPAAWVAKCARAEDDAAHAADRAIVWADVRHEIYPPALAALGIPLDRLFLLHPPENDLLWAVAECLRCKGVAAVVAELPTKRRLTRIDARRLQLAAEQGGTVGLFLREHGKHSAEHAAATRWLVSPTPGERTVQRWKMQLIYGHGGRVGQSVLLEHHRDAESPSVQLQAHPLHPAAQLADRPIVPTTA